MRTRSTNVKQLADITNQPPSDNFRTPEMMSPPGTSPPTDKGTGSARKIGSAMDTGTGSAMNAANMPDTDPPADDDRELSEPVDAMELTKALEMEQGGGREREPTIVSESPMRKRQRIYGDR